MKLTTTPVGLGKTSAPNSGSGCQEMNKFASTVGKKEEKKEEKKAEPALPIPSPAKRSEPRKKSVAFAEAKRFTVTDFVSTHLK